VNRILIVDDDTNIAAALELRLRHCGFSVMIANDAIQAVRMAVNCPFDLIIMDISLPAGNGLTLAQKFQTAETTRNIPVIILTGNRDPYVREKAKKLKVTAFFEKPYEFNELLLVIRAELKKRGSVEGQRDKYSGNRNSATSSRRKLVLIVEDDAKLAKALSIRLKVAGFETKIAPDAVLGVQTAVRTLPDLILLDVSMPAGDGFAVAETIQHVVVNPPPIIFVTASKRREFRQRAHELGALAYFEKPYETEDLLKTINRAINHTKETVHEI